MAAIDHTISLCFALADGSCEAKRGGKRVKRIVLAQALSSLA